MTLAVTERGGLTLCKGASNPQLENRRQGPLHRQSARDITRARFGMGPGALFRALVTPSVSRHGPYPAPSRQGLVTHERPGKIRRRSLAHV